MQVLPGSGSLKSSKFVPEICIARAGIRHGRENGDVQRKEMRQELTAGWRRTAEIPVYAPPGRRHSATSGHWQLVSNLRLAAIRIGAPTAADQERTAILAHFLQ